MEIFPKLFGSYLSEGSVASLNYGLRIMFLLVGLLGQAVGTASYPYLSRLAAENRITDLNSLLNATLKRIALVIPCSLLIVILRREIVFLIFERGQFGAESTLLTANILVCLMIGAFAFAAQTIVNRGYYAVQNTLSPTLFVTSVTLLSLPLYYLGMIKLEIYGIALALSLSTIIQVILLFMLWNRKSGNREGRGVYWFYLKIALLSIPIGCLLIGFKLLVLNKVDASTMFGSLVHLFSISIVFVVAVIGSGYLLKIKEIFEISDALIKRIRRWQARIY
jgi:putative peptidoglycan lipid II flippase